MKKPHRILHTVVAVVAVLIGLTLLVGVGFACWYESALKAKNPDDGTQQGFAISEGESSRQIAENLASQNLIRSALAFRIYLKIERPDALPKSGNYRLSPAQSVAELVDMFNAGSASADTRNVTFIPGATVTAGRQVFRTLGYDDSAIDRAFAKNYDRPLFDGHPSDGGLEGYLFGDTYEVYVDASVEQILTDKVFAEMEKFVTENNLVEKYRAQGLSLYEGITLASIVEREASTVKAEMPKIAGVFFNRLHDGIPLGSCAVVGYKADLENPQRDKNDLSFFDTIACPWNSRRCVGLPPTPIATPGREALLAVASPEKHDFYFFMTDDDGVMHYGRTEAEHQENVARYCGALCEIY